MTPEDAKKLYLDEPLKEAFSLLRTRYNKEFESVDVSSQDAKDRLLLIRLKFSLIKDFYAELRKSLEVK